MTHATRITTAPDVLLSREESQALRRALCARKEQLDRAKRKAESTLVKRLLRKMGGSR